MFPCLLFLALYNCKSLFLALYITVKAEKSSGNAQYLDCWEASKFSLDLYTQMNCDALS